MCYQLKGLWKNRDPPKITDMVPEHKGELNDVLARLRKKEHKTPMRQTLMRHSC